MYLKNFIAIELIFKNVLKLKSEKPFNFKPTSLLFNNLMHRGFNIWQNLFSLDANTIVDNNDDFLFVKSQFIRDDYSFDFSMKVNPVVYNNGLLSSIINKTQLTTLFCEKNLIITKDSLVVYNNGYLSDDYIEKHEQNIQNINFFIGEEFKEQKEKNKDFESIKNFK